MTASEREIEAASSAVVAEWKAMLGEMSPHMSAGDIAKTFVSPGNHRLIRAALLAASQARETDVAGLVERLNALASHGCEHDMGFDREMGPLGCALECRGGCICAAYIPAIRQAATALSGQGWRSMESAPKDGTRFLAWPCLLEGGHKVAVETYWYSHPSVQGWITDLIDCNDYDFEPTHWLPAPLGERA